MDKSEYSDFIGNLNFKHFCCPLLHNVSIFCTTAMQKCAAFSHLLHLCNRHANARIMRYRCITLNCKDFPLDDAYFMPFFRARNYAYKKQYFEVIYCQCFFLCKPR